jgi:hypothetical protein
MPLFDQPFADELRHPFIVFDQQNFHNRPDPVVAATPRRWWPLPASAAATNKSDCCLR